jgi:antirestriction protein ArdC
MHKDVYNSVTERIIADLEQGVRPWQSPWRNPAGHGFVSLPLRANGEPYRGINTLLLWLHALDKGFVSPHWLTFKQAQALGAQVRKGERASQIVYAGTLNRTETDDTTGTEVERGIPFLKAYAVFNADQIDGLPDRFIPQPREPIPDHSRNAQAEAFIAATSAEIRHGGAKAYYSPSQDHIQLPPFANFIEAEGYYATLCHELAHWTGHSSRLDRDLSRTRWGDAAYAAEELVAELGAAFICAQLQLTPQIREGHAAYIACWLKVLKADKRAIFTAAAQAQRAADFLLAFNRPVEPAMCGQAS